MENPKHDRLLQTTIPGGVGELRYLQVEVCRDGTVVLGVEEVEGGPAAGVALGVGQILELVRILRGALSVSQSQRDAAELIEGAARVFLLEFRGFEGPVNPRGGE